MKQSTFSESQIVRALKEVEGGRSVNEVAREPGVAKATRVLPAGQRGGRTIPSGFQLVLPPRRQGSITAQGVWATPIGANWLRFNRPALGKSSA
ncbi:transposase [Neolewinella xylanilytica]|uniref:transposase n=1 Tax=Neolewinella xylanilytica TaxID=1514080 RepID=UPI000CEB20E3